MTHLVHIARTATTAPTRTDWIVAVKGLERASEALNEVPKSVGSIFNRTIPATQVDSIRGSIDDALLGVEMALQRTGSPYAATRARDTIRSLDELVIAGKARMTYRDTLTDARRYTNDALVSARHELRSSQHREVGEQVSAKVEAIFEELDRMGLDTALPTQLRAENAIDGMIARGVLT